MRITVEPEGREGVWLPDRTELVAWLRTLRNPIHSLSAGAVIIGADWNRDGVIEAVREAARVALLTGPALKQNLRHALSVVTKDERLYLFDVGDVSGVIQAKAVS